MPTLEWIGKEKVINHHQEVPYRILDKKYTYNAESSENMIIHGDNLLALKSLLPQYEGRVDCIYIDPPYNTAHSTNKNQRWVYNDNVDDPRIKKWLGEVVGDEGEDLSRHEKWLCMMYPRLVLLHRILSNEGVIFISIDDNEFHNLKYLLDDIFGRKNHITTFAVENNPKGRKNNAFVSEGYEYCFLYCKNKEAIMAKYEGRVFQDVFNGSKKDMRNLLFDQYGSFKQSKRQVSGSNKSNALCSESKIERCFTIYYHPETENLRFLDEYDSGNDVWILTAEGQELIAKGYIRYTCSNNVTGKPSIPLYSKKTLSEKHLSHGLYFKDDGTIYEKERDESQQITSFLPNKRFGVDFMTETATRMLEQIFGKKGAFNNSKNVEFIRLLVSLIQNKNALILDSFAGSGTTAHAVLDLNKQDGGNRKFILVEMMDYADTITAERVKRVIKGYTKDKEEIIFDKEITIKNLENGAELLAEAKCIAKEAENSFSQVKKPIINNGHIQVVATSKAKDQVEGLGGDFSYYELGAPLFNEDKNLNEEVGEDEIRKYVYYMETKLPLEVGADDNRYYMGKANDTAYYFYYEKDKPTTLNRDFLATVKTKASGYLIYADVCALPKETLDKNGIVFKKIPRDIKRL